MMSATVFVIVLFAAALHATWNAIVKGTEDTVLTTAMVTGSAALLAALALPFVTQPAPESWAFIAVSVAVHIAYFALVAWAYHFADMSQAYPLMRGTAPLLVAITSGYWIGEHLSAAGWIGVSTICVGILSLAFGSRGANTRGIALAMLNAFVIAGYTLLDGIGARLSGAPFAYNMWMFLLTGSLFALWALVAKRRKFTRYVARYWHLGLIGGFGTLASYGLVLWAMTLAPVAIIAALRETSILFGTAIAGITLSERISLGRLTAVGAVACGAIVLRLT